MSRILPPKKPVAPPVTTTVRLPGAMLEQLDSIAAESGHTRTDVVLHFLAWAIQEYEAEKRQRKK